MPVHADPLETASGASQPAALAVISGDSSEPVAFFNRLIGGQDRLSKAIRTEIGGIVSNNFLKRFCVKIGSEADGGVGAMRATGAEIAATSLAAKRGYC
jgi:hypothetical protein